MKVGSFKDGSIKLVGILFTLSLFVMGGIGCGDRDEADPPVVNDLSPHAPVPKTVLATIPVGDEPWDIVVAPDGGHVYVANSNDGTISVINTEDNSVFTTEPIVKNRQGKNGIAITPDGKYVYVTSNGNNALYILNTETNTVVTDDVGNPIKVNVGDQPLSLAITPDGNRIYVANYLSNTVSVIEITDHITHTVIDEISVGNAPYDLAITSDGQYVYVVNRIANEKDEALPDTVTIIQTLDNTVIQTVTVGNSPRDIAVGQDKAYVVNYIDDNVSVIDMADYTVSTIGKKTSEDTLGIGNTPMGVALTPDELYLYVANESGALGHTLTVVETESSIVIGEIELEDDTTFPHSIAIKPDGNFVYVTDYQNDSVIVIGF